MTRSELIKCVARRNRTTQERAESLFNDLMDIVIETLVSGEELKITGFGTFRTSARPPRRGYDFRKGSPIEVPEKKILSFTPSVELKNAINAQTQEDIAE